MKKLLLLSSLLFILCGATIFAQNETVTTSKISTIDKSPGDNVIVLDIGEHAEKIQSRIEDSQINTKDGFYAKVDRATNQVSVSISKHYTNEDLVNLFKYFGIELTASDLNSISQSIND